MVQEMKNRPLWKLLTVALAATILFALPAQGLAADAAHSITNIVLTPGDGSISVWADCDPTAEGYSTTLYFGAYANAPSTPQEGMYLDPAFRSGRFYVPYTFGTTAVASEYYDTTTKSYVPFANGVEYYIYFYMGNYGSCAAYGYGTATPVAAPATLPTQPAAAPAPVQVYVPASYQKGMIINCNEWVSVRIAPEAGSEVLGRAYLGEIVELMKWDSPSENWCWVSYNGGMNGGWVDGRYIQGF